MLAKDELYNLALTLQPLDKAKLIEELMLSLDTPNSVVESAWNTEVEKRVDRYEMDSDKTITALDVFKKYEN